MNLVLLVFLSVLQFKIGLFVNIAPRYSLFSCQYDTDCIQDAFCKNHRYCTCKEGYVPDKNMSACIEEAKVVGDPCIKDIQCTAGLGLHSECSMKNANGTTGKCQCSPNAHFKENTCHLSIQLGGHCHVSADCKVKSNVSVYCDTGTCVCPTYYHPTDDHTDCLASSYIGEPCRNKSDCIASNSVCLNICRCNVNFVVSYDSRQCLPVAKTLDNKCEEDVQCQAALRNTVCDRETKQCQCSNTSKRRGNTCWTISGLGESCNDTIECVIPSNDRSAIICDDRICKCTKGFKENRKKGDCLKSSSSGILTSRSIMFLLMLSRWFL